jgi:hypothetical protein
VELEPTQVIYIKYIFHVFKNNTQDILYIHLSNGHNIVVAVYLLSSSSGDSGGSSCSSCSSNY